MRFRQNAFDAFEMETGAFWVTLAHLGCAGARNGRIHLDQRAARAHRFDLHFCRTLEKKLLGPYRGKHPKVKVGLHCAPIEEAKLEGPYDVIVLTGSVPVLPEAFQQSLNAGGRLIAVVGEAPVMQARLITKAQGNACNTVNLLETCIPPLKNALQPQRFEF